MQETGKRSDEHNDNMIGGIKGLRKQGIIAAIAAWQKTVWYPVVFALLGVISASFGWQVYVPVFYVMAVSVVFAALFCDDFKVMLVPIFLAYYCIGSDTVLATGGELLTSWTTAGFVNMITRSWDPRSYGGFSVTALRVRWCAGADCWLSGLRQ